MAAEIDTPVRLMGPFTVSHNPPLYLSGITKEDLPELVRAANVDKAVYYGTGTFTYPLLQSQVEERLARAEQYRTTHGYNGQWVMRISPEGPPIGWISIHERLEGALHHPKAPGKTLKTMGLGYWVSSEHSGKGIASRAAIFVKHEIVVKELGADVLMGEAYVWNKASQRVLEKIGLAVSATGKFEYIPKFGEEREVVTYAWYADGTQPNSQAQDGTASSPTA